MATSQPRPLTATTLRKLPLPSLEDSAGKEGRGRVLIVAGSREMPGAAILTAEAALRVGAGKVRLVVPAECAAAIGSAVPESYVIAAPRGGGPTTVIKEILSSAKAASSILVGPGVTDLAFLRRLLPLLLAQAQAPLVLDAFALPPASTFLRRRRSDGSAIILTPHAGETAQLLRSVHHARQAPAETLHALTSTLRAHIALKGSETWVGDPTGTVLRYSGGHFGLGTAGSGDVLAGLVAGLCARGAEPLTAISWAVWLHGQAGQRLAKRLGPLGYLARDLAREMPALLPPPR